MQSLYFGLSLKASAQNTLQKITAANLDYRKNGSNYLLVLKRGQSLIATLNAFMEKDKFPGASISGIGAVHHTEIGYYNMETQKYQYKRFEPSMEVLSLQGNLGYFQNKPIVHAHIALGWPDYAMFGGHVKETEVSLILEIFITPTTNTITREWNENFAELRTMMPVSEN